MCRSNNVLLICFKWIYSHFISILIVLSLLTYAFTYIEDCFGSPVRADGAGYFMYLPAYIIYADPSFEKVAVQQYDGDIPSWTGVRRLPSTGKYFCGYSCGVAIMMLPFFLLAHLVTYAVGWGCVTNVGGTVHFTYPPNGYSFFYMHAAGLAGLFYMVAGIAILKKVLEKYYRPVVVFATLMALLFGTNLFHYGTGETVLSHPYSFFLFCVMIYLVPYWYQNPSYKRSVFLAVTAGLIPLVRPPNIYALSVIPLWGLTCLKDIKMRCLFYRKYLSLCVGCGVIIVCVCAFQQIIGYYASGKFFFNSYAVATHLSDANIVMFNFADMKIWSLFFSLRAGVFFWSPILLFSVVGLPFLYQQHKEWFWSVGIMITLQIIILGSFVDWALGGSFPHRGFVEILAFLALPLAAFFSQITQCKMRLIKVIVLLLCILFVCWRLFFMVLYYTRELSYYGLDAAALFDIFWWRKQIILHWWYN